VVRSGAVLVQGVCAAAAARRCAHTHHVTHTRARVPCRPPRSVAVVAACSMLFDEGESGQRPRV
jgi:hypothetical protein